jgi:fatty acid desaturase
MNGQNAPAPKPKRGFHPYWWIGFACLMALYGLRYFQTDNWLDLLWFFWIVWLVWFLPIWPRRQK